MEANKMTVNSFLKAIAAKLDGLFPLGFVFVNQIDSGADGNHFVRCVNQSHKMGLDRQRKRSYTFEIAYFLKKKDKLTFNDWAETMYREFEEIEADSHIFYPKNAKAEPGADMVFHFIFDIDFTALTPPLEGEIMERIKTDTKTKE